MASTAAANGSDAVLRVSGALTFATAAERYPVLSRELRQAPVESIDLSGLDACDSAGLACVLALLSEAEAQSGAHRVSLRGVPAGLRSLAEVSDLGWLVDAEPQGQSLR